MLSFVIISCNPIIGTTLVSHIYALRVGPVTPKNKRNRPSPKPVYSVSNLSLSDRSKWNQPNQACQLPNPVNKDLFLLQNFHYNKFKIYGMIDMKTLLFSVGGVSIDQVHTTVLRRIIFNWFWTKEHTVHNYIRV